MFETTVTTWYMNKHWPVFAAYESGLLDAWIAEKHSIEVHSKWINKESKKTVTVQVTTHAEVCYIFDGDVYSHQEDVDWFLDNFTKVE